MSKRSFIFSVLITISHYYDYHLFGLLASKISEYFIPKSNVTTQLMHTYFIMMLSVTAKSIGSIILGRIGDIYGRTSTFTIGLLGTASASLFVAILPGYESIGLFSSFGLLLSRMLICAFTASGSDGIRLFVHEKIGKKYKCFGSGIVRASLYLGSFIASLSVWVFTLDVMPEYAWRISFALGGILGVLVVVLQRVTLSAIDETLVKNIEYHKYKDASIFQIISNNFYLFVVALLLAGAIGSCNQFNIIFFGTYIFKILRYLDESTMKYYTIMAIALQLLFSIIAGYLADIVGRKFVATISTLCLLCAIICMAYVINTGRISASLYFVICIFLPFLMIPGLFFLKQSIPLAIRYRMFSLAHALGSILISGPTAWVATTLYSNTSISWLPMIYFLVIIIIMITTIYLIDLHSKKLKT